MNILKAKRDLEFEVKDSVLHLAEASRSPQAG